MRVSYPTIRWRVVDENPRHHLAPVVFSPAEPQRRGRNTTVHRRLNHNYAVRTSCRPSVSGTNKCGRDGARENPMRLVLRFTHAFLEKHRPLKSFWTMDSLHRGCRTGPAFPRRNKMLWWSLHRFCGVFGHFDFRFNTCSSGTPSRAEFDTRVYCYEYNGKNSFGKHYSRHCFTCFTCYTCRCNCFIWF